MMPFVINEITLLLACRLQPVVRVDSVWGLSEGDTINHLWGPTYLPPRLP